MCGKLARWGMALQQLELNIIYRPGRLNANADALSCVPLVPDLVDPEQSVGLVVAAVRAQPSAKSGEDSLQVRQELDSELRQITDFLEHGVLPEDEKKGKELVLTKSNYQRSDGVLYHLERDKTLRIIPLSCDREKLFHEVHDGVFGAHVKDAKIHGELGGQACELTSSSGAEPV